MDQQIKVMEKEAVFKKSHGKVMEYSWMPLGCDGHFGQVAVADLVMHCMVFNSYLH